MNPGCSFCMNEIRPLLFWLRRENHVHLFAFEFGHRLHFGELFEVRGKTEQQNFTLFLEDDRPTPEEDIGSHFGTLLEKVLRVLQLEVVVVIVGLRAETNLLDDYLI